MRRWRIFAVGLIAAIVVPSLQGCSEETVELKGGNSGQATAAPATEKAKKAAEAEEKIFAKSKKVR